MRVTMRIPDGPARPGYWERKDLQWRGRSIRLWSLIGRGALVKETP